MSIDERPGITMADSDPTVAINRTKATYTTRDIWQAAFLDAEDIDLLDIRFDHEGRAIWIFLNTDDRAWQTGRRFRDGVNADLNTFRRSYKRVAAAVKLARRGETVYGAHLG